MKKKKIAIIAALSASCVAVLATVFVLTREPKDEFAPAAADTTPATNTWRDTSEPEISAPYAKTETQVDGTVTDRTQTIISEDAGGSTTSLSNSTTKEEAVAQKPADKPQTEDDTTDKNNKPDCGDKPSGSKPEGSGNQDNTPPADNPGGNSGHEGQIYDPVFGWVTPGRTVQDTVDSDGDINKQIGTMGGN